MGETPVFTGSRWRDLNPRPLDYESSALPLSHIGNIFTVSQYNSVGRSHDRVVSQSSEAKQSSTALGKIGTLVFLDVLTNAVEVNVAIGGVA
jgi:hypothetical protein